MRTRVPRVRMVPGRLASRTSALHQQRTDTGRAFADGPDAAMLRRLVDRLSNRSQFCWTADRCGDASSQRSFRFKGVFQWLNTITARTQPIGHRIPWDQAVVLRWVSSPAFCCGCQFCTCFCDPSRLGQSLNAMVFSREHGAAGFSVFLTALWFESLPDSWSIFSSVCY